ncbi:MAG TPA: YciI-like protein [Blastocatellia bacterium]|nr:YciI-like protein [Blastocatellia bacterium]
MKYFALFYYVVDGFVSRRTPFREEHLRLAGEANRRGELVLAGALGDPADRALLVFRAEDGRAAGDFARNDPYVLNGLVTRWEVQPWAVVIGNDSTTLQGGVK